MDSVQRDTYKPQVDKWLAAVKQYGQGWDEDGPEIPVDYELDVEMARYYLGGLFKIFDGTRAHLFTQPRVEILARVRKVKAHMNRMISAVEFSRDQLALENEGTAIDIWQFLKAASQYLADAHHGTRFRVMAHSKITTRLLAHCTGLPSSLPWDLTAGCELVGTDGTPGLTRQYHLGLRTPVFTTCPFVLYETNGQHSHTQRTYIDLLVTANEPMIPGPIMREICTRLVPVMSNMKIPDEVVQVCKSYAGPTFTEDGAVRVVKILRGITAEFCPDGDVRGAHVKAISEDSHLAHDIETALWSDLA